MSSTTAGVAASSTSVPASVPPVPAVSSSVTSGMTSSSTPLRLERFMLADKVTQAEIKWALLVTVSGMSNRLGALSVSVLKDMIPVHEVVQQMALDRTKLGYVVNYGLGPYFASELRANLEKCSDIVLGFDESLNEISKREQMDMFVWFWPEDSRQVKGRYLTSVFLESTRASDLLSAMKANVGNLIGKTIQVSIDGPNVNKKTSE